VVNLKELVLPKELIASGGEKPKYEFYICNLCTGIVKDPKSCEDCEDLFCSFCLDKNFEKNKNCCPNCKMTPFSERKLNKIAKQILNDIEIGCPFYCGQVFKYENLQNHSETCIKNVKIYTCKLCEKKIKIENNDLISPLLVHNNLCPNTKVKCMFCDKELNKNESQNHLEICDDKLVECKKCNVAYKKKFELSHFEFYCEKIKSINYCFHNLLDKNLIINK